jgi:hypothetical protein
MMLPIPLLTIGLRISGAAWGPPAVPAAPPTPSAILSEFERRGVAAFEVVGFDPSGRMSEQAPAAAQAPSVDFAHMEQQLARAWVESDRATIDRIIASDWTTIAISGQLLTRAEVMADFFRTGKSPIAAMIIDDVRVRLLGEVVVVTGRTTARAIGSQTDVVLRFTDVFALRDGRWQIVASQGTRTAP